MFGSRKSSYSRRISTSEAASRESTSDAASTRSRPSTAETSNRCTDDCLYPASVTGLSRLSLLLRGVPGDDTQLYVSPRLPDELRHGFRIAGLLDADDPGAEYASVEALLTGERTSSSRAGHGPRRERRDSFSGRSATPAPDNLNDDDAGETSSLKALRRRASASSLKEGAEAAGAALGRALSVKQRRTFSSESILVWSAHSASPPAGGKADKERRKKSDRLSPRIPFDFWLGPSPVFNSLGELPPSVERASFSIRYSLKFIARRKSKLLPARSLTIPIVYLPCVQDAAKLEQKAKDAAAQATYAGPSLEPDEWVMLANAGRDYHLAVFIPRVSTTTMAGNGGNMAVRVPRGTSIHYVLEVRCEFQEDMDMLDDTRDVRAVLEEDPQRDGVAAIVRSNGNTKSAGSALFPTGAAARLAPRSKRVRVYQGLVKVSPELCPSFTFGQVSCSYTMRFIVARDVQVTIPVEVVNTQVPSSASPPTYHALSM